MGSPRAESYDVVVIGGGPAGTVAGQLLHRSGHRVLVVERGTHPRFCVGESLLPGTMPIFDELGLLERFEKAGFLRKYGTYFSFEDGGEAEFFHFPQRAGRRANHAYQVRRAEFDALLWDAAREAGVECCDLLAVQRVSFEGQRASGVELALPDGTTQRVQSRLVMDCSGRATVLARQLAIRERDAQLDTVALYRHYDDVLRSTGEDAGTIAIIAAPFGWLWLIPFAGGGASVGATVAREWYAHQREARSGKEAVFAEILERAPAISRRLAGAKPSRPVEVTADFSYRARELAGDGWVLVGDAGAFLDPVFSSGVHLAVSGARWASLTATKALAAGRAPRAADFAGYARKSRAALRVYSRFIYAWYDPYFRQVLMRPPRGRPGVELLKREVLAVLAGTELRPWRALPAIGLLQMFARLRRAAEPSAQGVEGHQAN